MEILTEHAQKGFPFTVTVRFSDLYGRRVTPKTVRWSLLDLGGAPINGLSNVPYDNPASEIQIVIEEADLAAMADGQTAVVDVDAIYNPFLGKDLPPGAIGSIMKYLEALIELPNTRRARTVAMATGRQDEFPSDSELRERITAIETEMEEYAVLPMVTVI